MNKIYTGTVYFGVVGSEIESSRARDSIQSMTIRPGDGFPVFNRWTKGFESRQDHVNRCLDSKHDFLFLADSDQVFPNDAIEKLRRHQLPYVTGLYLRRQTDPLGSVWYKPIEGNKIPPMPFTSRIEKDTLYPLGASGWGCILIHRDVLLAVREQIKGEWEIFEDDMDIYPYDLKKVMLAMKHLRIIADQKPPKEILLPALDHHLKILEQEIVLLRGDKSKPIGSDIRFPFFAKKAGYQLFGDSGVRVGHVVNFPLSPDHYDALEDQYFEQLTEHTKKEWKSILSETLKIRKEIRNG